MITLDENIFNRQYNFNQLRKGLRLVVEDTDEAKPTDISYVHSGYAPLSIRLVQCATQKTAVKSSSIDTNTRIGMHPVDNFKGFVDQLKYLPGSIVEDTFNGPAIESVDHKDDDNEKKTLIFFVGGVTFAEISALRLMNKQIKGMFNYFK